MSDISQLNQPRLSPSAGASTSLGMKQRSTWLLMLLGLIILASVNGLLVMMTHDLLEVFGPIMMSEELRSLLPESSRSDLVANMKDLAANFLMLAIPAALAAGGSWYLSQLLPNERCSTFANTS